MILLSITILSYNTKELTLKCVQSVIKHYKKQLKDEVFEIIVVDNASTDGSVRAVRNLPFDKKLAQGKQFQIPNLKIIENRENFGFSKGNNIGAKQAKGKYLFFLNSDTQVKDSGLVGMVDFLDKHENVGVCGAKLINTDRTAQSSAGKFYNIPALVLVLVGGERLGFVRFAPKNITRVDWVSGGAMMVRGDLFRKLGGFDEHLFMYIEDMEFCWRAKRKGITTYFYPGVSIIHQQLGSSNRTFAILNIYKGLLYFYKKHASYMEYLLVKLLLAVKACIAILIGMLTGNAYITSTYKKALALLI